jgi:hypothetical protein
MVRNDNGAQDVVEQSILPPPLSTSSGALSSLDGMNAKGSTKIGYESLGGRPAAGTASMATARAEFDEAIRNVLSSSGGELLFRVPSQADGAEEIAAVRLGKGGAQLLALVILPQGAPLRVEPVDDSANPLAPVVRSYATLIDVWQAAA